MVTIEGWSFDRVGRYAGLDCSYVFTMNLLLNMKQKLKNTHDSAIINSEIHLIAPS